MAKRKKKKRDKKFKRDVEHEQNEELMQVLDTIAVTREILAPLSPFWSLVEVLQELKIKQQANALFPKSGSNLGYPNSTFVNAFVMMFNKGAECLKDAYQLDREYELLKPVGIKRVPLASELKMWLHRHGEAGVPLAHQIIRTVIAKTLKSLEVERVTLDINTTTMLADKTGDVWTDPRYDGFTPIIGTIVESGQVIAVEFGADDVPPSHENAGFIDACQAQLPDGVELKRVRLDEDGYQKGLIDGLAQQNIEFVIRARMDEAIRGAIAVVPEADWKPLRLKDGSLSQNEWVVRRSHMIHYSGTAFDIVMQRSLKSEVADLPNQGNQGELLGLSIPARSEFDQYSYLAIATNIEGLDDSQIVDEYNQHEEYSENRIEELKSDFAAGRLPCDDFGGNALYVCLCALSYNVFALMRAKLPAEFRFAKVPVVREQLFGPYKRGWQRW